MLLKLHDMYCIKIYDSLEEIIKLLSTNEFKLKTQYNTLDICIVSKNIVETISCKSNLKDYIILYELSNGNKGIETYDNNFTTGKIENINLAKELLINLGYCELFRVNMQVYEYINLENIKINIFDIKNFGAIIAFDKLYLNKKTITELLSSLNKINNKMNKNFNIDILDEMINKNK